MAPGFWLTYFERLAIVALILTALYSLARKLRDVRIFARAGSRLSVLESAMLTPNAAVHVVKAGARYFLIGSGSSGVTRLAELHERSDSDAVRQRDAPNRSFLRR